MTKEKYDIKNLHEIFRFAISEVHSPDFEYLFQKGKNIYQPITYTEFNLALNAVSAQFVKMNFIKGDRVAILSENCAEYFMFDQGLQQTGLINVSIYPTLSENEIEFIYNDADAKAILIGSPFLLKKFLKVQNNLKSLEKIIILFDDEKYNTDERIITWKEFISEGKNIYPSLKNEIERRFSEIKYDDIATFIYTSGTTGNPKGAMLSHGNIISDIYSALSLFTGFYNEEILLSFLPLSHIYERMVTYYLGLYRGSKIYFAEGIDKISKNIGEAKPTVIACVPRVLEKIEERIKKNIETQNKFSQYIFNKAMAWGNQKRYLTEEDKTINFFLKIKLYIAEKLVYKKIKKRLGGRMKFVVSGGAALPIHTANFFSAIGLKVIEGYGLTETSPFISVNEFERQIAGTVGRVGEGQEVAIMNVETKKFITIQNYYSFDKNFECEEGEILMRGPNLMKGYWNQPYETKNVIDNEGWFHTGDIGKFYKGNLKITDRIKNIIINAFGKNIYPTTIENVYLQSRKIEQIFIIGDKQEYITAIIVPSEEELKNIFKPDPQFFTDEKTFIEDNNIIKWIEEDLEKYSTELAKFERIKNFIIKRKPFSIDSGEMTPKQSIKRKVVEKNYKSEIEKMYIERD